MSRRSDQVLNAINAILDVTTNAMKKAQDEADNRRYARNMGWSDNGIMVALMNHTSERRRKANGYKFYSKSKELTTP